MLQARALPSPAHSHDEPTPRVTQGRYQIGLAASAADLDAALRLRFEVFNLELGEGLRRSLLTGRDHDEYDAFCRHLIVRDRSDGTVVGTYRVQTAADARRGHGFYTASEFDLSALPPHVLDGALELGRACIARAHRNTRVLYLLWRGIAELAQALGKRWLFGCCSLTSQDPRAGRARRQRVFDPPAGEGNRRLALPPGCPAARSAPVAAGPGPAAGARGPVTGHPGVAAARDPHPAPGDPDVAVAAPCPIAVSPRVPGSRGDADHAHGARRGRS